MNYLEDKTTVGTPEYDGDWSLIHRKQEDGTAAKVNRLCHPLVMRRQNRTCVFSFAQKFGRIKSDAHAHTHTHTHTQSEHDIKHRQRINVNTSYCWRVKQETKFSVKYCAEF